MIKYIITILIFVTIILSQFAFAQDEYIPTVLFVIPWGNDPGELSMDFQTSESLEVFEPGPYAVSENGNLVIFDHEINAEKPYVSKMMIKKFDRNGNLIAFRDIEDYGILLFRPCEIAILNSGEVAVSSSCVPQQIFLLDASLNLLHEITLPYSEPYCLFKLTPSNQSSFWLAFNINTEENDNVYRNYYKTEIFLDGTYSTPEITWDDVSNTGVPAHYISPTGEPFLCQADMYGYIYTETDKYEGLRLNKQKLNEQETEYESIFTHTVISDPGWDMFDFPDAGEKHFVTWQGDFYIIHATDAGMVLTKYTLNLDPVCDLIVVTPMPYQGPSPAAIEFDASNTYDPNPDDVLTFEWDFDGDGVFNEPVDDAYTGDQNHPTHEYTQNYEGFVTMRVTDNHEGECDLSVYISVVIQ